MRVHIAVLLLLAAPVALGQSVADVGKSQCSGKQATQNNARAMTETKKETSKPTPKAIAAAEDALIALVTRNQADYDRAEVLLKIESSTDAARNAPLYVSMITLVMSSEIHGEIDDLPSACVGGVNKQLRAGIWSGLPESCPRGILVATSSRR